MSLKRKKKIRYFKRLSRRQVTFISLFALFFQILFWSQKLFENIKDTKNDLFILIITEEY